MSKPFALHMPSPALVVALIALFVALGGTGYAATQLGASGESRADLQALKHYLRPHAVPHAIQAANAGHAAGATSAQNAVNAVELGRIGSWGYTHDDCITLTGQVKGFAYVHGGMDYPSSLTAVSNAYNCSGQAVQARRISAGVYEVHFLGSPVTVAMGTSMWSASTGRSPATLRGVVVSGRRILTGTLLLT